MKTINLIGLTIVTFFANLILSKLIFGDAVFSYLNGTLTSCLIVLVFIYAELTKK